MNRCSILAHLNKDIQATAAISAHPLMSAGQLLSSGLGMLLGLDYQPLQLELRLPAKAQRFVGSELCGVLG